MFHWRKWLFGHPCSEGLLLLVLLGQGGELKGELLLGSLLLESAFLQPGE